MCVRATAVMEVERGLCFCPLSVEKGNKLERTAPATFKADCSVNKPLTTDHCYKRMIILLPGGFVVRLAFLKKHEIALPDEEFFAALLRDLSCVTARRRPPNSTEISTNLGAPAPPGH